MLSRSFVAGMMSLLLTLGSRGALAQEATAQEGQETPVPQEEGAPQRVRLGAGYVEAGVAWPRLTDLSGRLVSAGFSSPGNTFIAVGAGGHAMLGRLFVGGEAYVLTGENRLARRGDVRARLSAAYAMVRVGYALLWTRNLGVYVLAGAGSSGLRLDLTRETDLPFEDVITNASAQANLTATGLLFDASLGAEYRIPLSREEKRGHSFLLIGVRAGYSLVPVGGNWETPGGKVTNAPDLGLSGPSVKLLIGFGGQSSSSKL